MEPTIKYNEQTGFWSLSGGVFEPQSPLLIYMDCDHHVDCSQMQDASEDNPYRVACPLGGTPSTYNMSGYVKFNDALEVAKAYFNEENNFATL